MSSNLSMHDILGRYKPWNYDFASDPRFAVIISMKNIPQPVLWHPEGDVYTHTMETLCSVSKSSRDFKTRLAALLHDIGKTATYPSFWPHHHEHDTLGLQVAEQFMDQFPDITEDERHFVLATIRCHMSVKNWSSFRPMTKDRYFDMIGEENIWRFALVVAADHTKVEEVRQFMDDSFDMIARAEAMKRKQPADIYRNLHKPNNGGER